MPRIIDIESTGIMRSDGLDNKPKQKYGLSAKLPLAVFVACKVAKKPHIFITRANKHIQEINKHFDGTLNHFGPMEFAANQEQN